MMSELKVATGLMLTVGQWTISGYNFIMTDHVTDRQTLCQYNFCPDGLMVKFSVCQALQK
jgi:hypothetical protein